MLTAARAAPSETPLSREGQAPGGAAHQRKESVSWKSGKDRNL